MEAGDGTAGGVATVLVVFGRGVHCEQGRYLLTAASVARVEAAVGYVATHTSSYLRSARQGQPPRVVFTGGWAEACDQAEPPPLGSREADLMLRHARRTGLDRYAELWAESRSRSTLENLVQVARDGLLPEHVPDASRPLGIVSHVWHLPRVRFLAARVLGLRGAALLDVPAFGGEPERGASERMLRVVSRLTFMGARTSADLLRREQRALVRLRRAERALTRLRRSPPAGDLA